MYIYKISHQFLGITEPIPSLIHIYLASADPLISALYLSPVYSSVREREICSELT